MATVTAKTLIASKAASNAVTTEYTVPANTKTIIDKFTATNNDASARTVSVYLVPSGSSAATSNLIAASVSMNANATYNFSSELQNHILSAGDTIQVVASVASVVTIRASGREIA